MSYPDRNKSKEALDLSRDPIKHFVRLNGWVEKSKKRLHRLEEQDCAREFGIRYFTLCGKEGVDIFLFQREELIKDNGRGFPSVFYCENDYESFVAVKELLGQTLGARDTFEHQMTKGHFQRRIQNTPFDIVNLDFSGACFPQDDQPFSETLTSIESLIHFQGGHSFDLFITFKALRQRDNREAIIELSENMNNNFSEYEEIREKFENQYEVKSIDELLDQDYGRFLLVTFPKIMFSFGRNSNFEVECQMKYVYKRTPRRGRATYQIIKFLFSFKSIQREGTFTAEGGRILDSEAIAASYKSSILSDLDDLPIDVDEVIKETPNLFDTLRLDNEQLLNNIVPFGISRTSS